MIEVEIPGEATAEFPDSMSQDDIHAALKKHFSPTPTDPQSPAIASPAPAYSPMPMEDLTGKDAPVRTFPQFTQGDIGKGSPALPFTTLMNKVVEPAAAGLMNLVTPKKTEFRLQFGGGEAPPLEQKTVPRFEAGKPALNLQPSSVIKPDSFMGRMATGMSTPGQVATLPLTLLPAGRVAKGVQALYTGLMAEQVPQQIAKAIETGKPEDIEAAEVGAIMLGGMAHGLTREAKASIPKEIAPLIDQAKATLPKAAAEAEKTLSETPNTKNVPGAASETSVPEQSSKPILPPEHQAYLDTERAGIDAPIEVQSGEPVPASVDAPFAARKWESGDFMRANHETGKIEVNGPAYSDWLDKVPADKRPMAVRSRLFEEQQHLQTSPEQAKGYWDTLTDAEKTIEKRVYTGKWKGVDRFSDTQYGFEAIRRQKQRLARMDSSEAAEAALKERWTVKSLEALNSTIRSTREAMGTKASKEGLAIMARIEQNSNAAISAIKGGSPAAYDKSKSDEDLKVESVTPLDRQSGSPLTDEDSLRYRIGEPSPAAFNKNFKGTAEEALKQPDGTLSPQDIFKMPESEYVKLNAAKDENGNKKFSLTEQATLWAMKQSPDVLPALKEAYKKESERMNSEFDKGNFVLMRTQFAHDAIMALENTEVGKHNKEAFQSKFNQLQEAPAAYNKRKDTQTPEFFLPPMPKDSERLPVDVQVPPEARRLKITPADIDWSQRGTEGAYRPITEAETANPAVLGNILTTDARIEGSQSPVSSTRRLTAMVDNRNGEVHLVSTYKSGRSGAMIVNPERSGAERPNIPIADALERYKPIYSVLRDSPVKNFHQKFDSMEDFQARFGEEALQKSQESLGEGALAAPVGTKTTVGGGKTALPDFGTVTEAEKALPSEPELRAFHDHFEGEIPPTLEDFQRQLKASAVNASKPMVRAVQKAALLESEANPQASPEANIENALSKLYEDLKTDTRTDFLKASSARLRQSMAATVPEREVAGTGESPAAYDKLRTAKEDTQAAFDGLVGKVRGAIARRGEKQDVSVLVDKAQNQSVNLSQETKRAIQQPSSSKRFKEGDAQVLSAARAINAAGEIPDATKLPEFVNLTKAGQSKAKALISNPTEATLAQVGLSEIKGLTRAQILKVGRDWLKSATALENEVGYAASKFGSPDLMQTAQNLRAELRTQLIREHRAGKNTVEAPDYLPGLYEGELYGDKSVTFDSTILGKSYGKPKTFANQYEAIAAGPYIPKMNSVADIAAHRVRSGMNSILRDQAFKSVLQMTDPMTKTPIAIESQASPNGGFQVPGGNLQYELVHPMGGGKPIAVRKGYVKLMNDLFGKSGIQEWTGGKALMAANAVYKHTTLAMDLFHPNRLMDYALAIVGKDAGFKGALAALEFRPNNMAEAVKRGVIRQSDMDWALEKHEVTINGQKTTMTQQQILKQMQNRGFNIGRVQDAMYKHFVDSLDVTIGERKFGIGAYNRLLFDKFTRGLMSTVGVKEFIRQNKAAPNMDADYVMRRVVKDINTQFGSVGKQGLIKNPTFRDLAQLLFLAPQWAGSRIATEAKFLSRTVSAPYVGIREGIKTGSAREGLGSANVQFGSIGRGVGRGLVTMFALTQAVNLFTRKKFTWQNEEDDHKLDAFVPDFHGGPGHWISPMSVFLEMTHDVARYKMSSDKNTAEIINQIGENKLGGIGRSAMILGSGYTPTGQKITTTTGRFKEAGKALVPFPLTFGAIGREAGHAIAPNQIAPNPPGKAQHQLFSTFGIKSEVAKTPVQEINRKADQFMRQSGLKKETGWVQVQTDEPNYTKLRQAIHSGDKREAASQYQALRKTRSQADITKAMRLNSERPFTGSKVAEPRFRNSLSNKEEESYQKAKDQKKEEFKKFLELLWTVP